MESATTTPPPPSPPPLPPRARPFLSFVLIYVWQGAIFLSVVTNLVALAVFLTKRFRSRRVTKLLLPLTVADLLFLVFGYATIRWNALSDSCSWCHQLLKFPQCVGLTASIYMAAAISVDRYLSICRPFFSKSDRAPACLVSAVACFSLLWGAYQTINSDAFSSMYDMVGVGLLLLTRLAPLVVMSVLSALVVREVRRSAEKFKSAKKDESRTDAKVTKMLLIIIAIFACCHAANFATLAYFAARNAGLFSESAAMDFWSDHFAVASNVLLSLNSTFNLAVYVGRDGQFREVLAAALAACCGCCRGNDRSGRKTSSTATRSSFVSSPRRKASADGATLEAGCTSH